MKSITYNKTHKVSKFHERLPIEDVEKHWLPDTGTVPMLPPERFPKGTNGVSSSGVTANFHVF